MDGPAKSRLRWHLEKARDYVDAYNLTPKKNPGFLEKAESHLQTAEKIYEEIIT